MRVRSLFGSLVLVLAGLGPAVPVRAQQGQVDDLRKDIESLREMLKEIQKDLQEIKASLPRRFVPTSAVNAVVDFSRSPSRGERTAPLTLVEFSDYQ